MTVPILPTNMDYLDQLLGIDEWVLIQQEQRPHHEKLARLIENNRVLHFMKSQGYRTVHIGASVSITKRNRYADINVNYEPVPLSSEFSTTLFRTTILEPISERFGFIDWRKVQWKRIQYEMDELGGIASHPEPTYVFAHFVVPHDPYVFDVDGSFVPIGLERERDIKDNYTRQVIYLNSALEKMFNRILKESDVPPIIVLQSDHGSGAMPDMLVLSKKAEDRDFQLREAMRNFSAIYIPEKENSGLSEKLTPVNVWRVILNQYFGTRLPLLPNKNFFQINSVPGLMNVTDVVQYK